MRQALLIGLLTAVTVLQGCAFLRGEDNAPPPAELTAIQETVVLEALWKQDVAAGTDESFLRLRPVVDGGRVFAASHDGTVAAFEAASGKSVWETSIDRPISGGVGAGEGLILVGTSEGEVVALDWRDGSEVWRSSVSSEILTPPQAGQGLVVVQSVDGNMTALSSASGTRQWVFDRSVPVLTLRGTSTPTLVEGYALIGQDSGKVAAVELERGVPVWETPVASPSGRSELERIVDIDSPPLVWGEHVYAATYQGQVAALAASGGRPVWSREMSSAVGLGIDFRNVYVTDEESRVLALDRRSGAAVWQNERLLRRELTAPAALEQYVLVADFEGYVHALSRIDGEIVGRTRLADTRILAKPLAVDDRLYLYGADGTLGAYRLGTP